MADDKKKKNIFSRIVSLFKDAAAAIVDLLTDGAIAESIRGDLGLKPGGAIPAATGDKFVQFAAGLDPDKEALSETIAEITDVAQEIKTLAATLETEDFPASQVSYTLFKLGATDSVRLRWPFLYALSRSILFVEEDTEALIMIDPARLLRQLRGEDLPSGELLAQRITGAGTLVLQLLDAFTSKEKDDTDVGHVDVFYGWDPSPDSVTPKADLVSMRAVTFNVGGASATGPRLLASLLAVPPEHGGPGIFLSLGGELTLEREITRKIDPNGDETESNLRRTKFRLDAGAANGFDAYFGFGGSRLPSTVPPPDVNPFLKFAITGGTADEPSFRLGEPNETRLDIYQTEFGINVSKDKAGFHAALRDAELVIAPGKGDSFLRTIAGDGAKLKFSVGIIADSDGGFRLDGGTKASATLPVGRSIAGVLTVHHVAIGLGPSSTGGDLGLELSGAFTAHLGPFSVVVDRLGFQLDADRRENANFGPFQLDLGFKAPNGLGLLLDTSVLKGGGYLYADPANNEYAGAFELLLFGKFGIKAIGVLTTRPNDWSLLLLIFIQFPIPTPAPGFTVYGVGGLIGVQHGIDLAQLIAGMKTKAFDDILFPDNPVGDAPRILNRLRTVFPLTPRAFTIGPMFDMGWGTPKRIVFIRVGLLIQVANVFGSGDGETAFSQIVLIGQLRVELGPTKEDATITVVKLVVDIVGFWDLDKKRYGFVARLRDSKIAKIDITGSLAVWGEYGDKPRFLLAAGGFNPRFKDVPTEIGGVLDRLGAAFKVGRFSLTLTGYFALSPGTIQFGVNLAAKATIGPVGLTGDIGFDALIYREPTTHFLVDFHIKAAVTFKGHSLAGVKVEGTIEGPGLWHVKGKVTFSILWWDIDKSFDETWGTADEASITQTSVVSLLTTELNRRENWTAQLPAGGDAMATIASRPGELATLAHPLGRFTFSQRIVPLGLSMERFGEGGIDGPNRFDVTSMRVGDTGLDATERMAVRDHFPRSQFLEMTEEDRLTRASFEEMDAGVEFSSAAFSVSDSAIWVDMEYETAYLDIDPRAFNGTRRDSGLRRVALDMSLVGVLAGHGAAGRAPQRLDERNRAKTGSRIDLSPAPLAAAERTVFAADPAVSLGGQARTVEMIAEQQFRPDDEERSQLVEEFELVGV
jgi:hypothetical protein